MTQATDSRFLQWVMENETAVKRIEALMNKTGMTDDGEVLFVSPEDAAELWAIINHAWSMGEELGDFMALTADRKSGRAIAAAHMMQMDTDRSNDDETHFKAIPGLKDIPKERLALRIGLY